MFEFRFYDVAAGRRADEVMRMHEVAIAGEPGASAGPGGISPSMFDRYGIPRPLGAWTSLGGPRQPLFGYILKWDNLEQRDRSFPPFWADPAWRVIRDSSDDGSPMVERTEDWLMMPSAAWRAIRDLHPSAEPHAGGYGEMLIQKISNGHLADAVQVAGDTLLPKLWAAGAVVLGVFDMVIGPDMPAIVTFLSWPDFETQEAAWRGLHMDPGMSAVHQPQADSYGQSLFLSTQHFLTEAAPFGIPSANFGVEP